MNEEEKKALRVINARTRILLDELEIEKEDMSDEPRIAYLMQEIRANKTILNLIEKLQKENEEYSKQLDLDYVDKNYIPIQKVKDEKEKLDKKYNELVDKVYKDPLKALTDFQRVVGGQAILNTLLKEGET